MTPCDRRMFGLCGLFVGLVALIPASHAGDNLIIKPSRYSVSETIDRIEQAVTGKGMKLFARINHAQEAKQVGLDMPPTELLIFGNPKGGTALMLASPTVAIDLPMKALAWEDSSGRVWLSYNAPQLLRERHGLSEELAGRLDGVGILLDRAVE